MADSAGDPKTVDLYQAKTNRQHGDKSQGPGYGQGGPGPFSSIHMNNPNFIAVTNCNNVQIGHRNIIYYNSSGPGDESDSTDEEEKEQLALENSQIEQIKKSNREVSNEELRHIAKNVGGAWRRLIRFLGVQDYDVDEAYSNYHAEGIHEVIYQLLRKWKQEYTDTTVSDLFAALDRADLYNLWKYLKP